MAARLHSQATCSVDFEGGIDESYKKSNEVQAVVWSTCNVKGPLFNTNLAANIKCDKDAILGVDTTDTRFEMKWHLQWKRC